MKSLYIIRHAKSSWKHANLDDFDRPLNERGKKDAPFMAQVLKNKGAHIEEIVSSPAKRAITTAQTFAEVLGISKSNFKTKDTLYLPTTTQIMDVVTLLDDKRNSVAIFGHNPGFSDFLDYMTGAGEDMPTCSVARVDFDIDSWKEISSGLGKLVYFEYPKKFT